VEKAERAFAHRSEPAQLAAAIDSWKQAAALEDSAAVRVALARAEHFGAQLASGEARREGFARAIAQARQALALDGVAAGACTDAPRKAAPALYWLAESLDQLSRELGLVKSLAERAEALCLARRVAELDEGYFHAAPLRLLGRVLAQAPALMGGDAEASRKAFERAEQLAPGVVANKVDFAGSLAVKLQDAKGFAQALEAALAQPRNATDDELGPENRIARERARALKARAKALFE
jgi:hypothetical protein